MKMKKKTKQIVVAMVLLAIVVVGIFVYRQVGQDKGAKEITIIIKVDTKEIYKDSIDTDAATLAALLKEMKEDKDIKLEYKNEAFGMYITGMGIDKLYKEDPKNNKYWIYTSNNNKQCVDAGFCDAADDLKIKDKDEFVFQL